jgi:hypothetical protein
VHHSLIPPVHTCIHNKGYHLHNFNNVITFFENVSFHTQNRRFLFFYCVPFANDYYSFPVTIKNFDCFIFLFLHYNVLIIFFLICCFPVTIKNFDCFIFLFLHYNVLIILFLICCLILLLTHSIMNTLINHYQIKMSGNKSDVDFKI